MRTLFTDDILFKVLLFILKSIPFLIILLGIIILCKIKKIDFYKDKRIRLKNIQKDSYIKIKFKQDPFRFISLTISTIVSIITYYYMKDLAKAWYLRVEILILCVLIPFATVKIVKDLKKYYLTKQLPVLFQSIIDEIDKGTVYAIRNSTQKIYKGNFKNSVYDLADDIEENNVKLGLKKFYINSGYNVFIYEFICFLEKYLERGGDIRGYLQKLKLDTTRYINNKESRRVAMFITKLVAIICILFVPLGIKFGENVTLGYAGTYYASLSGQNLIAFALIYAVIVLIQIYALDRE